MFLKTETNSMTIYKSSTASQESYLDSTPCLTFMIFYTHVLVYVNNTGEEIINTSILLTVYHSLIFTGNIRSQNFTTGGFGNESLLCSTIGYCPLFAV